MTLVLFIPVSLLVRSLSSLQQLHFGSTLPKAYFYYCVMDLCLFLGHVAREEVFYAHVAGKLLMLGELFPFSLSLAALEERLRGCLDHF